MCFILLVIDLKVISKELLNPIKLWKAQVLYINKLSNVIIIYKSKNSMLTAFQVVFLFFKSFNNS